MTSYMSGLDQRKPTTGVWSEPFIKAPTNKLLKLDTYLLDETSHFYRSYISALRLI